MLKKTIIYCLLILMILLPISGCSNNTNTKDDVAPSGSISNSDLVHCDPNNRDFISNKNAIVIDYQLIHNEPNKLTGYFTYRNNTDIKLEMQRGCFHLFDENGNELVLPDNKSLYYETNFENTSYTYELQVGDCAFDSFSLEWDELIDKNVSVEVEYLCCASEYQDNFLEKTYFEIEKNDEGKYELTYENNNDFPIVVDAEAIYYDKDGNIVNMTNYYNNFNQYEEFFDAGIISNTLAPNSKYVYSKDSWSDEITKIAINCHAVPLSFYGNDDVELFNETYNDMLNKN